MRQKPVMLLILDGWGYRKDITKDNAIEQGHTPNWHRILQENPHCLIETSGLDVGLPNGQMGNSEVGHMNLGAGRVVMQDLPKIDLAIKDGSINKNPVVVELIDTLKKNGKTCHVMGLMSPGGVHSHQSHIIAMCKILAENGIKVRVHAFLDGRDTPPTSAKDFVAEFEKEISGLKDVKIATVEGRFYAMDRDKRWDRVELAYDTIALGEGKRYATAEEAIAQSYKDGVKTSVLTALIEGRIKSTLPQAQACEILVDSPAFESGSYIDIYLNSEGKKYAASDMEKYLNNSVQTFFKTPISKEELDEAKKQTAEKFAQLYKISSYRAISLLQNYPDGTISIAKDKQILNEITLDEMNKFATQHLSKPSSTAIIE